MVRVDSGEQVIGQSDVETGKVPKYAHEVSFNSPLNKKSLLPDLKSGVDLYNSGKEDKSNPEMYKLDLSENPDGSGFTLRVHDKATAEDPNAKPILEMVFAGTDETNIKTDDLIKAVNTLKALDVEIPKDIEGMSGKGDETFHVGTGALRTLIGEKAQYAIISEFSQQDWENYAPTYKSIQDKKRNIDSNYDKDSPAILASINNESQLINATDMGNEPHGNLDDDDQWTPEVIAFLQSETIPSTVKADVLQVKENIKKRKKKIKKSKTKIITGTDMGNEPANWDQGDYTDDDMPWLKKKTGEPYDKGQNGYLGEQSRIPMPKLAKVEDIKQGVDAMGEPYDKGQNGYLGEQSRIPMPKLDGVVGGNEVISNSEKGEVVLESQIEIKANETTDKPGVETPKDSFKAIVKYEAPTIKDETGKEKKVPPKEEQKYPLVTVEKK